MRRLIGEWRRSRRPVVFVRHDSLEPGSPLAPGTRGNGFKEVIDGEPDLLVVKHANSAFHGQPDLDRWLGGRGLGAVAICGITTNDCCETTARIGGNLGYQVLFVTDATHTFDRVARDGRTITADELQRVTETNLDREFASVLATDELLAPKDRRDRTCRPGKPPALESNMPRFTVTANTPLTLEAIIAALTDFGPRRPELWPNLAPGSYRVEYVDGTEAEVTEGSSFLGGVWERLRYDWSTPGVVRLDVLDGNATKPGSFWEYRVRYAGEGRTEVSLELDRRGRGLKGAALVILLGVFGKRVFAADLRKSLERIATASTPSHGGRRGDEAIERASRDERSHT